MRAAVPRARPDPRRHPGPCEDSARRAVPGESDVRTALQFCLAGDRERSYDDIVLLDDAGACGGIVRVTDLLQEATVAA